MNTGLILIDWGTSNFRLWHVARDFRTLNTYRSGLGMSKLKQDAFEPVLEKVLAQLGVGEQVPVLICGMAGAAQGWQDAGYVDAPAVLDSIASNAVKVNTNSGRDVRILPGIAQRVPPDVMRGEETLLLGAQEAGLALEAFCLPGTHCKWVSLREGTVRTFRTFMTGELFELLTLQSTLSHFLQNDPEARLDSQRFEEAVLAALRDPGGLTKALFGLRAGPLVGMAEDAACLRSRLSGMLIGSEIAAMKNNISGRFGLVANGIQAQTYGLALTLAGIEYELLDSETLILSGLRRSAKHIWGNDDAC